MTDFILKFKVSYTPKLAGGGARPRSEEFPLRVDVFATHELLPKIATTFKFSRADLRRDGTLQFTVDLPLSLPRSDIGADTFAPLRDAGVYEFAQVQRLCARGKVSRSVHIVLQTYATTLTDERHVAVTRVGTAEFSSDLLTQLFDRTYTSLKISCVQNQNNANERRASGDRSIRTCSGGAVKGQMRLSKVRLCSADGAELPDAAGTWQSVLLPAQPLLDVCTDQERASRSRLMSAVVTRSMHAFNDPTGHAFVAQPTLPFMRRYHCPEERDASMFEPSLSAVVVCSARTPSSTAYYYGLATRVLIRRDDTARAMCSRARAALSGTVSSETAAFFEFLARLMTIYAASMPYLDDWINYNDCTNTGARYDPDLARGNEDMESATLTGADDCESTAQVSIEQAVSLFRTESFVDLVARARAARREPNEREYTHTLLMYAQRALLLYVPCLALFVVTNRKLTYGASQMQSEDALAHTPGMLVPRALFEAWIGAETGRNLLDRVPVSDQVRDQMLGMRGTVPPLLMCEGTQEMSSTILPLENYFAERERDQLQATVRNLADRARVAARVQSVIESTRLYTEIFHTTLDDRDGAHKNGTKSLSRFYQHCVSLQTAAMGPSGVFDFSLVYKESGTYGVTFNDLVQPECWQRIKLVPTLKLSAQEAATIDMILALNEPVPPLDNSTYKHLATNDSYIGTVPSSTCSIMDQKTVDHLDSVLELARRNVSHDEAIGLRAKNTSLQPRIIVISARAQDIGPAELRALQTLAADHSSFWQVEPVVFRLSDRVVDAAQPVDMLDFMLRY